MRLFKTITITAAMSAALAVGGCGGKSKHVTQKEAANAEWNAARAGVLNGLARDQFQTGNFDKARQTITEAQRLDPKNANLWVLSARLSIEVGQLEQAEKDLTKARELDPKNADADYLSGVVYQRWQKPELAFAFYSAAAEKSPAELAYLMAKAEMLVATDRAPEALNLLMEKVVYFEHSPVIRDAAGMLLVRANRYGEAVEMFRQASILSEKDLSIREHLALAYYYNGQYREAANGLKRLVETEEFANRADLHMALGECQLHMNQPAEARSSYETATQQNPGSPEAWTGLAKAALEAGDTRRAELAIKKSVGIDPASGESYLLLGYLRLKQERFDDALSSFQKASALDATDAVSVCMIGYVYEKMGRNDVAIENYGKALRMRPGDDLATKLMASINPND